MSETETPGLGHNNPPEPTLDETFKTLVDDVEKLAAKANLLPAEIQNEEKLGELVEVVRAAKRLRTAADEDRKASNRPLDERIKATNGWFRVHDDRLSRMVTHLERRAKAYHDAVAEVERERRRKEAEEQALRLEAERKRQEEERAAIGEKTGIDAEIEAERLERLENETRAAEARTMQSTGPLRTGGGTVGTRKGVGFRILNRDEMDLNELKDSFTVDALEKAIRDHIRRHKKTKPLKGVELFDDNNINIR